LGGKEMKNVTDVSSEEELLQLREEGKISEDEYKELLAAIQETIKSDSEPACQDKPVPARTCGVAIASLVFSIVGPITCIPAIVCGHLALRKIRSEPGLRGYGLALAGLIIGYIVLGLSLVLTILVLGVYLERGEPVQFAPAEVEVTELKRFGFDDAAGLLSHSALQIDRQISRDGNGLLRIGPPKRMTIRLFETGNIDIEDAPFIYQARLQMDAQKKAILEQLRADQIAVGKAKEKLERLSGD
jgi:hypothetical protein